MHDCKFITECYIIFQYYNFIRGFSWPCQYGLQISLSLFSSNGVNTNQELLNLHSQVHPVNI